MADTSTLMRQFYDEVVNHGRIELLDEIVADDFVEHEEFPGMPQGKDGVKEFVSMMRSGFPDLRFDVEDVVASGDTAVARVRMRGTHEGTFMGVPASGRKIDVPTIDWVRFRGDQVIEHWGVTDTGALMEQLSAVPTSA